MHSEAARPPEEHGHRTATQTTQIAIRDDVEHSVSDNEDNEDRVDAISVQPDSDDGSESPLAPDDNKVAEEPDIETHRGRSLGLQSVEFAASGRAKCWICKENGIKGDAAKIADGSIRFVATWSLAKPVCYVHTQCVAGSPSEWITGSLRWLGRAIGDRALEPFRQQLFEAQYALDMRQAQREQMHSLGASSSSAPSVVT